MTSLNKEETEEERPDIEEFSDTQKLSMNRLKPEIKLTSVEPAIRDDSQYDSEENAGELYEEEEPYDDYEDEEYDDSEYYDDDEYDDEDYDYDYDYDYDDNAEYEDEYDGEYDYEAEEDAYGEEEYEYDDEPEEVTDTDTQGYSGEEAETSTADYAYDYDAEEDESEDASGRRSSKQKNKKPLVIGIVCGIIVLILAGVIIWFLSNRDGSAQQESSVEYTLQQVTGVVTRIDEQNETLLFYTAEGGVELSLSMEGAEQRGIAVNSISVGSVLQVQYQSGGDNLITAVSVADSAENLYNVQNAVPNNNRVTIEGTTYTIDDKLVCLYQGEAFDVQDISANTTYNAIVVDDHIYTIQIVSAPGTLVFSNVEDYVGATVTITPASGDTVEMTLATSMDPIELQEGSVQIEIRRDNESLYSGKTFISAGKENVVRLPSIEESKGMVVFESQRRRKHDHCDRWTAIYERAGN